LEEPAAEADELAFPLFHDGNALENFERGMTALFKVPKAAIVPLKKRGKTASPGAASSAVSAF
jgi:hypothetical protein